MNDENETRGPFNICRDYTCACPNCGAKLNAAAGIGRDATPQLGDKGICAHCGALNEFVMGEDGKQRLVPLLPEEITDDMQHEADMVRGLFKQHIQHDPVVGMKDDEQPPRKAALLPDEMQRTLASALADRASDEEQVQAEFKAKGAEEAMAIGVSVRTRAANDGGVNDAIQQIMGDMAKAFTRATQTCLSSGGDPTNLKLTLIYAGYEIGEITAQPMSREQRNQRLGDGKPVLAVSPEGEVIDITKKKAKERGN